MSRESKYREKLRYKIFSELEEINNSDVENKEELFNSKLQEFIDFFEETLKSLDKEDKTIEDSVDKIKKLSVFNNGDLFASDEKITLKVIDINERDKYISLSRETSPYLYDIKKIEEEAEKSTWKELIDKKALVCSIYDAKTDDFIGYCSIKNLKLKDWELAIEEFSEFHNKGYGTRALKLFIDRITEITGNRFYRIRINMENYASQHMVEKVGAYPNGISEWLLHGEFLEEYQEENKDSIDDKMREVADKFCMDPEDMLGYVLEYRIDMYPDKDKKL